MAPIVQQITDGWELRGTAAISESEREFHGAISLRSISPHPSLLRNDTFPRKGGTARHPLQPQAGVRAATQDEHASGVDAVGEPGRGEVVDRDERQRRKPI